MKKVAARLATMFIDIRATMQNLAGDFGKAKGMATDAMNTIQSKVSGMFGMLAGAAGIGGLALGMRAAVGSAINFEEEMAKLAITTKNFTDSGSENMKALAAAARKAGAETQFTAAEAAATLNQLAGSGLTAQEAIKALPAALQTASATGFDLVQAARVTTDAMARYGIAAEKATDVTDMLVEAKTRAGHTFGELAEALNAMGASSDNAGVSFRDTVTILTTMAKGGERASEAGTALRIALQRMSEAATKDTKEARDLREELMGLGFDITKFVTEAGTIPDALAVFEALAATARKKEIDALFGARGARIGSIMNILTDPKTAGFMRETAKALDESAGLGAQAAATKMATFKGQWLELTSALEEVAISVLHPVLTSFKTLLDVFTEGANIVSKFNTQTANSISFMFKFAAAIGAATTALIVARRAVQFLGVSIRTMLISTGIGALIVAAGAAMLAISKLVKWLSTLKEVQEATARGSKKLEQAFENIRTLVDNLFTVASKGMEKVFGVHWHKTTGSAAALIVDAFSEMVLDASEWLVILADRSSKAFDLIHKAVRVLGMVVYDVFNSLSTFIPQSIGYGLGLALRELQDWGNKIFNGIIEITSKVPGIVFNMVTEIAAALAKLPDIIFSVFSMIPAVLHDIVHQLPLVISGAMSKEAAAVLINTGKKSAEQQAKSFGTEMVVSSLESESRLKKAAGKTFFAFAEGVSGVAPTIDDLLTEGTRMALSGFAADTAALFGDFVGKAFSDKKFLEKIRKEKEKEDEEKKKKKPFDSLGSIGFGRVGFIELADKIQDAILQQAEDARAERAAKAAEKTEEHTKEIAERSKEDTKTLHSIDDRLRMGLFAIVSPGAS